MLSYIQQGIDFEGIPTRTLTILYTMQSLATSIPTCLCIGIPNSTVVPRKGSDKGNVGLSFYSDIYTLCIGGWSPSSCSFYTSSCFPLMVKKNRIWTFFICSTILVESIRYELTLLLTVCERVKPIK